MRKYRPRNLDMGPQLRDCRIIVPRGAPEKPGFYHLRQVQTITFILFGPPSDAAGSEKVWIGKIKLPA
jgi:hypothetical protein